MIVTWSKYKSIVAEEILLNKAYVFRGQSNSIWKLATSLHRTGIIKAHKDFVEYFEKVIPFVQEPVEAWDGTRRDLSNPFHMAEFLAFLQHNGFPTPLLDWTFSPYIAAYFAFEGVKHFAPDCDYVAIYAFNQLEWLKSYKQTYDYKEEAAHVTMLNPTYRGNHKQMLQQGTFWYTNCQDSEGHVFHNSKYEGQFLTKYEISVKERPFVMNELSLMGITAIQLFPSVESVCKKAFEDLCITQPVGLTPADFESIFKEFANKPVERDREKPGLLSKS